MKKKQKINKAVNSGEKILLGLTALFLCALFFLSRRPTPQRAVTVRTSANRAPAALTDGETASEINADASGIVADGSASDGASVTGNAEASDGNAANDGASNVSGGVPDVSAAPVDPDGRININVADVPTLCSLPGIGDALAGRIVDYRETYGPFSSTADIMNVSGIGEGKYKAIAALIVV